MKKTAERGTWSPGVLNMSGGGPSKDLLLFVTCFSFVAVLEGTVGAAFGVNFAVAAKDVILLDLLLAGRLGMSNLRVLVKGQLGMVVMIALFQVMFGYKLQQ